MNNATWIESLHDTAYLRKVLAPDETITLLVRQHSVFLAAAISQSFAPILCGITAVVLAFLGPSGLYQSMNTPGVVLAFVAQPSFVLGQTIVGLLLLAGGLLWMAWQYMQWRSRQFLVTDRRVMHIDGVLNKRCIDSSLVQINDCKVEQSWVGRQLDYGDVTVFTASGMAVNVLPVMLNPIAFRHAVDAARQAMPPTHESTLTPRQNHAITVTPQHPMLAAANTLTLLHEQGTLSRAEYTIAMWRMLTSSDQAIHLWQDVSLDHATAMRETNHATTCNAALRTSGAGYYNDLFWIHWQCSGCDAMVATVDGGSHTLNYANGKPVSEVTPEVVSGSEAEASS